jgi:hypothetical protein
VADKELALRKAPPLTRNALAKEERQETAITVCAHRIMPTILVGKKKYTVLS